MIISFNTYLRYKTLRRKRINYPKKNDGFRSYFHECRRRRSNLKIRSNYFDENLGIVRVDDSNTDDPKRKFLARKLEKMKMNPDRHRVCFFLSKLLVNCNFLSGAVRQNDKSKFSSFTKISS